MPTYALMCERCKKSFEAALTVAGRAAATAACPSCAGGEVTPQIAIFTAKASRKSREPRDDTPCVLTPLDMTPYPYYRSGRDPIRVDRVTGEAKYVRVTCPR